MLLSTCGYADLDVSAEFKRILEMELLKSHVALCKFLTSGRERLLRNTVFNSIWTSLIAGGRCNICLVFQLLYITPMMKMPQEEPKN